MSVNQGRLEEIGDRGPRFRNRDGKRAQREREREREKKAIHPSINQSLLHRSVPPQSGKKESILDLARYIDKTVSVKLQGGRTVEGVLKGYDQLLNLVLDETIEYMRGKQARRWR